MQTRQGAAPRHGGRGAEQAGAPSRLGLRCRLGSAGLAQEVSIASTFLFPREHPSGCLPGKVSLSPIPNGDRLYQKWPNFLQRFQLRVPMARAKPGPFFPSRHCRPPGGPPPTSAQYQARPALRGQPQRPASTGPSSDCREGDAGRGEQTLIPHGLGESHSLPGFSIVGLSRTLVLKHMVLREPTENSGTTGGMKKVAKPTGRGARGRLAAGTATPTGFTSGRDRRHSALDFPRNPQEPGDPCSSGRSRRHGMRWLPVPVNSPSRPRLRQSCSMRPGGRTSERLAARRLAVDRSQPP